MPDEATIRKLFAEYQRQAHGAPNICEECGLPMKACNALASYRDAVKNYKLGRNDRAAECAENAAEWEEKFLAAHRQKRDVTAAIAVETLKYARLEGIRVTGGRYEACSFEECIITGDVSFDGCSFVSCRFELDPMPTNFSTDPRFIRCGFSDIGTHLCPRRAIGQGRD